MNDFLFMVFFILFGALTFVSFFNAWELEEGTLGDGKLEYLLAESFNFWRFPTHYILIPLTKYVPVLSFLYFPALILNIVFYSIVIERFTLIFRFKAKTQ